MKVRVSALFVMMVIITSIKAQNYIGMNEATLKKSFNTEGYYLWRTEYRKAGVKYYGYVNDEKKELQGYEFDKSGRVYYWSRCFLDEDMTLLDKKFSAEKDKLDKDAVYIGNNKWELKSGFICELTPPGTNSDGNRTFTIECVKK